MFDHEKITLDSIAGGAALEKFQDALREVFENILDINTDPLKAREIKLTLKLSPSKEDRAKVLYSLNVEKKLAPYNPVDNVMYVGKDKDDLIGYEQSIVQGDLFPDQDERKHIIKLKEHGE